MRFSFVLLLRKTFFVSYFSWLYIGCCSKIKQLPLLVLKEWSLFGNTLTVQPCPSSQFFFKLLGLFKMLSLYLVAPSSWECNRACQCLKGEDLSTQIEADWKWGPQAKLLKYRNTYSPVWPQGWATLLSSARYLEVCLASVTKMKFQRKVQLLLGKYWWAGGRQRRVQSLHLMASICQTKRPLLKLKILEKEISPFHRKTGDKFQCAVHTVLSIW